MKSNTDGLIDEPEEEHDESGQFFGVEQFLELGNELIDGATLIGYAVGNVEAKSTLHGLETLVNLSRFFTPHRLKRSTDSGPKSS